MANYSINYSVVGKQQTSLTEQMNALSKVLANLQTVQETMLSAAQWQTADKKDFTERFAKFMEAGKKLHEAGVKEAEALQKISDSYKAAEQS